MIDEIDNILRKEGVIFDSSISSAPGIILFFNEGLFAAEVTLIMDQIGRPSMKLFKAEKKLYK